MDSEQIYINKAKNAKIYNMLKMKRFQLQPIILSHLRQQQFHEFDLAHWTLAWLQNQILKFNSIPLPALPCQLQRNLF